MPRSNKPPALPEAIREPGPAARDDVIFYWHQGGSSLRISVVDGDFEVTVREGFGSATVTLPKEAVADLVSVPFQALMTME